MLKYLLYGRGALKEVMENSDSRSISEFLNKYKRASFENKIYGFIYATTSLFIIPFSVLFNTLLYIFKKSEGLQAFLYEIDREKIDLAFNKIENNKFIKPLVIKNPKFFHISAPNILCSVILNCAEKREKENIDKILKSFYNKENPGYIIGAIVCELLCSRVYLNLNSSKILYKDAGLNRSGKILSKNIDIFADTIIDFLIYHGINDNLSENSNDKIKDDDIYRQLSAYPHPDHR